MNHSRNQKHIKITHTEDSVSNGFCPTSDSPTCICVKGLMILVWFNDLRRHVWNLSKVQRNQTLVSHERIFCVALKAYISPFLTQIMSANISIKYCYDKR